MNTPSPSRWLELFDVALSIIAQANRDFDVVGSWTFGGGTALMLHIDHRESYDIDLFIGDPQVLPYLTSPLSRFPDKVETALNVAERYRPDLLRAVLAEMNVRPGFEGILETAREEAVEVLRRALAFEPRNS